MTPPQLQAVITGAVRQALASAQTNNASVMAILEVTKLDVYFNMREEQEEKGKIFKAGNLPPEILRPPQSGGER